MNLCLVSRFFDNLSCLLILPNILTREEFCIINHNYFIEYFHICRALQYYSILRTENIFKYIKLK